MLKRSSRKKAGHRNWAAKSGRVVGEHSGDIMSPEIRSAVMSRIRAKNTSPERLVFAGLRSLGLSFARHTKNLPGRPDVVFRSLRIAIFIDGDFWHGWRFSLWKHKLSPKWQQKIESNRLRDSRNHRCLRCQGWIVLRIWEHQVEQSLERCIARIEQVVLARRLIMQSVQTP